MSASITNYVGNQPAPTSQINSSAGTSTSGTSSGSTSANSADLASGQTSLNSSYQTFLTLLTTQLKNQDPTSPLDPNQFTTELVQMTGVQQQLLSNQLLQQLVNSSPSSGVSSAVGLIGKKVTATSATANLSGGQANWVYDLPQAAANAAMTISGPSGQVVWTGTPPSLSAGPNTFTWNGQNSAGAQLADGGPYKLSISAADVNGTPMTSTISVSGTASSVQNVAGTSMVTVGATQVPVSSITDIGGP